MPKPETDNSGDKGQSKDSPQIVVEVDGEKKTFDTEGVKNLLAQQASATQKTQEVAAIKTAAEKYGLSPEEYVDRSEGAFATVVDLMQEGVLDNEGRRVEKEPKDDKPKVDPLKTVGPKVDSKELDVVTKALDQIEKRTRAVEEDNMNLMRKNLSIELQGKHPELNDDDVSRLFGIAMSDQKKNVWQHAEEFVGKKKEVGTKQEEAFAEKYGINLKEWNENKIKEQDAKGGGAAAILGKRKLSFRAKSDDPDAVSPRRAAEEFLTKQHGK